MTHDEVIKRFLEGNRRGTASAIRTDGRDLFLKGESVPLAVKLPDGNFLYRSASAYYGYHSLECKGEVISCSEDEMAEYCSKEPRPSCVVINHTHRVMPKTVDDVIYSIKHLAQEDYGDTSWFPDKKIKRMLIDEMAWHKACRSKRCAWEKRSQMLGEAMIDASKEVKEKIFKEACSALRECPYTENPSIRLAGLMLQIMSKSMVGTKQFPRAAKAFQEHFPGFRGVGIFGDMGLAVFGEDELRTFGKLDVRPYRDLRSKSDWRLDLLRKIPQSRFLTFDSDFVLELESTVALENL